MHKTSYNKPLVMKFGGASVRDIENFSLIAEMIVRKAKEHPAIVVVVSAMGNTTNILMDLAKKVHPNPPEREQDMLISVGERISIALLAMALKKRGKEAISFTGSQSGIITCAKHSDARIIDVRPFRILPHLQEKKIVIVAGFQGVGLNGEITTLGKGGSDTSAVAIAAALQAQKVEFYKDVDGIYSTDPKKDRNAKLYEKISFAEAKILAEQGGVLHPRCIAMAERSKVQLHVRSFTKAFAGENHKGTWIFFS